MWICEIITHEFSLDDLAEDLLFNGNRVSVLEDENVYGDGWWWCLHNILNIVNTTELYF